jgi:oxygen-dependent protoporphyrinogen oxidase
MGAGSSVSTPLLSARGKLRILAEPFVGRPKSDREESIAEFVTRRFGREVHDVFVSSFVSGIYAGDTSLLSAEAVFPKLVELERDHGGIVRGAFAAMRKRRDGAQPAPKKRRPMTVASFATGLGRLPEALAEALGGRVQLETPVERVTRREDGFVVATAGGEVECRDLVVAAPAHEAAALLAPLSPRLVDLLRSIEYPPLASVAVAFPRDCVDFGAEGFGFLVPRSTGLRTLGAIFTSSLFEGRAPEGWVSFTCFIGGATDPRAVDLPDDALIARVADDLGRTVNARGEPRVLSITRWMRAIPQYTIGHVARVAEIEAEAARAGVTLIGNYLHGVSVGDCVAAATKAFPPNDE